jgi:hypothetical protein
MRCLGTKTLPSLVVIVVVAACGAASTSQSPSPAAATQSAAPPVATLAPPSQASSPPTPATEPTGAPTPAALVLGGTWVSPKAGARLTSYVTTLSAKPTASGPGVTTLTKVVFSAKWAGAKRKTMCTATKPGLGGTWACKANLLALGVPPGKVTFSFDVHVAGAPAARSPDGPRKITYAVPPPRPANARWKETDYNERDGTYTYRVTWSAPAGYADEFLIFETFECPRPSTRKNANKPCFVAGTPVDASQLELRARAPGNARTVKVRPTAECWPSSILLRARNAYGISVFAIVNSAPVIWIDPDSNDTIC